MGKISVVIATYNGQLFIEEQFDSILSQTKLPDEVLISDDVSTDDTVSIINDYINNHNLYNSWKLYINDKNKGYARNFMDLALRASGDYIFFCDQDDIWDKQKIYKMSKVLDRDESINLLCSNLEPFYYGEGGRKWDKSSLNEMAEDESIEKPTLDYKFFYLQRSGCTMCIRKKYLHKIAPYWVSNWPHDDFVWKIAICDDCCAIYHYKSLKRRMHQNNASSIKVRTREWRMNQIESLISQYDLLRKYAKNTVEVERNIFIIDKNIECVNYRLRLLKKRNPFIWIKLYLKYKRCYNRKQAYMLDLYLTIFSKYKGVN